MLKGSDSTVPPAPRKAGGTSKAMRARAIVFMVVALAAGLGSAWLVMQYASRYTGPAVSVPMTKVVVAKQDIALASSLTPDLLAVVDWPLSARIQGSFDSPKAVEGRVAGTTFVAGEPILESRLTAPGAGSGLASLIPKDMRAMTVPINEVAGVAGFVHPRDFVDVITTMTGPVAPGTDPGKQEDVHSKIVLQDLLVLAVGQQLPTDTPENKAAVLPTVTLLVSPEDAERLALAMTQGRLHLALRSQKDRGVADTPGVIPPELLGLGSPAAPTQAAPAPAPVAQRFVAPARRAAAPAPAATQAPSSVEVVEVMHGDRVEQRSFTSKAVP
jgi:pilus assembly protein CpaB